MLVGTGAVVIVVEFGFTPFGHMEHSHLSLPHCFSAIFLMASLPVLSTHSYRLISLANVIFVK